MELKWEEPDVSRRKGKYGPIFEALRANPGRWAVFAERATRGTAGAIKQGNYKGIRQDEFDAMQEAIPGSAEVKVYARYIGDADA
jgi:hypothetical protein